MPRGFCGAPGHAGLGRRRPSRVIGVEGRRLLSCRRSSAPLGGPGGGAGGTCDTHGVHDAGRSAVSLRTCREARRPMADAPPQSRRRSMRARQLLLGREHRRPIAASSGSSASSRAHRLRVGGVHPRVHRRRHVGLRNRPLPHVSIVDDASAVAIAPSPTCPGAREMSFCLSAPPPTRHVVGSNVATTPRCLCRTLTRRAMTQVYRGMVHEWPGQRILDSDRLPSHPVDPRGPLSENFFLPLPPPSTPACTVWREPVYGPRGGARHALQGHPAPARVRAGLAEA